MKAILTEEEIIQTLKRTSLTTVIVEGEDDMTIYRWIENEIGYDKINFLPCTGRSTLLNIFKRKNEFRTSNVVFVADKDCYIYNGVPPEYKEIIWTTGYSIENDLYFGKHLERLLDKKENINFQKSLENYLRYYSFQYEKLLQDIDFDLSHHPNQVLDDNHNLCQNFTPTINYSNPNNDTVQYFKDNYELFVRGKSLFFLLLRLLSHRKRKVKHSKLSLIEHSYKLHRGECIDLLITQIINRISA
jgi:Protein of unknown function (DUF4435)